MAYPEVVANLLDMANDVEDFQRKKLDELNKLIGQLTPEDMKYSEVRWNTEDLANRVALALGNKAWLHVVDGAGVSLQTWVPSSLDC